MQIRRMKGEAMSTKSKKMKKQCFEGRKKVETLLIPNSITLFWFEPFKALHSSVCLYWDAEKVLCAFFAYGILTKWNSACRKLEKGTRCVFYFTFLSASHQLKVNLSWRPIDKCRRMRTRRQFIVSTARFLTALKRLTCSFLYETSKSI